MVWSTQLDLLEGKIKIIIWEDEKETPEEFSACNICIKHQGSQSTDEQAEEFYQLITWEDILESKELLMQCIGSLAAHSILRTLLTVSEAFENAWS